MSFDLNNDSLLQPRPAIGQKIIEDMYPYPKGMLKSLQKNIKNKLI